MAVLKLKFCRGPKVIQTQLCLSLVSIALLCPEWSMAFQHLFEYFGSSPDTVQLYLEFLTVLPEEIRSKDCCNVCDLFETGGFDW